MRVTLINNLKITESFELDHAQRILDLQTKTPPRVWKLQDDNYTLVNGVITQTEDGDSE